MAICRAFGAKGTGGTVVAGGTVVTIRSASVDRLGIGVRDRNGLEVLTGSKRMTVSNETVHRCVDQSSRSTAMKRR